MVYPLTLRSRAISACTRVFDALWRGVSKGEARLPQQHGRILRDAPAALLRMRGSSKHANQKERPSPLPPCARDITRASPRCFRRRSCRSLPRPHVHIRASVLLRASRHSKSAPSPAAMRAAHEFLAGFTPIGIVSRETPRRSFFVNLPRLYSGCRRKPAMAINGRCNKPIGRGGSTRRLHQSPSAGDFGGAEIGSTRV